jgi:hypothetical protein
LAELVASRTAEVAKASRSSVPNLGDGLDQRPLARLGQLATTTDLLGQPEGVLLGIGGPWVRAAMRVNHQKMDGVRTDVEHSESHTGTILQ